MYREQGDPETLGRYMPVTYRTWRCGWCGAWLVTTNGLTPPKVCGKCHR